MFKRGQARASGDGVPHWSPGKKLRQGPGRQSPPQAESKSEISLQFSGFNGYSSRAWTVFLRKHTITKILKIQWG